MRHDHAEVLAMINAIIDHSADWLEPSGRFAALSR
jgi:hypothetical protein